MSSFDPDNEAVADYRLTAALLVCYRPILQRCSHSNSVYLNSPNATSPRKSRSTSSPGRQSRCSPRVSGTTSTRKTARGNALRICCRRGIGGWWWIVIGMSSVAFGHFVRLKSRLEPQRRQQRQRLHQLRRRRQLPRTQMERAYISLDDTDAMQH